ncbi:MAG: glycoside hydrolase family 2 TIM barrel-domain containing protein [Xanthomonadales bacterium]|nr:glycoside hydrolase family 2 TIM barrel-domain containing protein [Xanthomonadales bacterium]
MALALRRSGGGLLAALCLAGAASGACAGDDHGLALVQNPAARQHTSLDGTWSVIPDPYETGYYNHRYQVRKDGYFMDARPQSPSDLVEYDFSRSQKLQVPGDWNSQDERLFLYEGSVWYHREFDAEKRPGRRYLLHFGAANYSAIAYLNGTRLGHHEGGFTPFQFDATEALTNGRNVVVVKVDNRREADGVPALNTDWWNYGGLTRPVRLLDLPDPYLADYALWYEPGEAGGSGQIHGWVQRSTAPSPAAADAGRLRLAIPGLGIERNLDLDGAGRTEFTVPAQPELWSPEHPRRYEVRLDYNGESVVDSIGFRHLATRGPDILLNGEPVFLRGISIHEEAPDRAGRAWSEADARTLLGWALDLGCNFVRLAHYPHNEAMLRMADELGLMVWSEIPVYWTIRFDDPAVFAKAERQLEEMIRRDRNRGAVVLWSLANETPGTEARLDFLRRLAVRARALDPTRLLTAASDTQEARANLRLIRDPVAEIVDVIGINSYCGWYANAPDECAGLRWQADAGKPVIVSEFGAGALQGLHGDPDQRWTEEYQAAVYRNNLVMLEQMPFLRGVSPWILKDFRSPRRPLPGIQDFWNRKGLLSETGERKLAWHLLRDWYRQHAATWQPSR